jgi:hypothetical protein
MWAVKSTPLPLVGLSARVAVLSVLSVLLLSVLLLSLLLLLLLLLLLPPPPQVPEEHDLCLDFLRLLPLFVPSDVAGSTS